ncbi:MAG: DUF2851 family protein [Flavobacteriaceae bacterium]
MRERLLHYIWKHQKFRAGSLRTSNAEIIQIINPGTYNMHSGPDFQNAIVEIEGQLWAGNIELHLRSSDWYAHNHQKDENYNNVILHVVWEEDRKVYRRTGMELPTLMLKDLVETEFLDNYRNLLFRSDSKFINCETQVADFDLFVMLPWLEHLFRERLESKTNEAALILKETEGDWERLFFIMLLANFGQRLNRSSFLSLARSLEFDIVKGVRGQSLQLESLLFGLSGLLQREGVQDKYYQRLKTEFAYLRKKYQLTDPVFLAPEFMRVRPGNFPTLRLSQFAGFYSTHMNLFSKIRSLWFKKEFYEMFTISASTYWRSHYNFGKPSRDKSTNLSRAFKDGLIINTVLPLKNLDARERGTNIYPRLRKLISQLYKEDNRIVREYRSLGFPVHHALDSQALIQLYKFYCEKNRCLECALGNQILN